MDQVPRVVTVLKRSTPHSSSVSLAETFHSFSTTPQDFENEKHYIYWTGGESMSGGRKDSGYEESEAFQAVLGTKHHAQIKHELAVGVRNTSQTWLNEHSISCPSSPIQRPLVSPLSLVPSSSKEALRRTQSTQRRGNTYGERPQRRSQTSSRRSSIAPTSYPASMAQTLVRQNSGRDPYAAHQRARELIESLTFPPHSSSSSSRPRQQPRVVSMPVRPHPTISASSLLASRPSISLDGRHTVPETNDNPTPNLIATSTTATTAHLPPTTIIDWTHPTTRRRAYERHDKRGRGLEGVFRRTFARMGRLCPGTKSQAGHGSGELGFWEGKDNDDDACSVRRYRIQLEDDEKLKEDEDEDEKNESEDAVTKGVASSSSVSKSEARKTMKGRNRSGSSRRWGCFGSSEKEQE